MDMPQLGSIAAFDSHFTSNHLTSVALHLKEYFDSPALTVSGELAQQVMHQSLCAKQLSISVLSIEKSITLNSEQDNHSQYYVLLIPESVENGVIISPNGTVHWMAKSGNIYMLRIAKASVEQQLVKLVGHSLTKPLTFEQVFAQQSELANFINHTIRFIAQQTCSNGVLKNKQTLDTLAELLVSSLLHNHGHNYHADMYANDEHKEPDYIQRVKHYIKQSWHEPISLDDIMAVAQVSKRNLYQGFQQHLGMPPMHYLKNVRLDQVHQQIKTGKGASVTQVAVRCGFTHLGRFANEYKRRFGESPSVTMQVSMQRCQRKLKGLSYLFRRLQMSLRLLCNDAFYY